MALSWPHFTRSPTCTVDALELTLLVDPHGYHHTVVAESDACTTTDEHIRDFFRVAAARHDDLFTDVRQDSTQRHSFKARVVSAPEFAGFRYGGCLNPLDELDLLGPLLAPPHPQWAIRHLPRDGAPIGVGRVYVAAAVRALLLNDGEPTVPEDIRKCRALFCQLEGARAALSLRRVLVKLKILYDAGENISGYAARLRAAGIAVDPPPPLDDRLLFEVGVARAPEDWGHYTIKNELGATLEIFEGCGWGLLPVGSSTPQLAARVNEGMRSARRGVASFLTSVPEQLRKESIAAALEYTLARMGELPAHALSCLSALQRVFYDVHSVLRLLAAVERPHAPPRPSIWMFDRERGRALLAIWAQLEDGVCSDMPPPPTVYHTPIRTQMCEEQALEKAAAILGACSFEVRGGGLAMRELEMKSERLKFRIFLTTMGMEMGCEIRIMQIGGTARAFALLYDEVRRGLSETASPAQPSWRTGIDV